MKEPGYIRQTETQSDAGDRIILCYFLTKHNTIVNGKGVTTYGVGIDMYTQRPNEQTIRERKTAKSLFRKREEAVLFTDALCKGFVTPTTLSDIVEDKRAEGSFCTA